MISLLLLLFFFILIWRMLKWGIAYPERYYTYPTLAGFTWLFYIFPMAVGAVINPDKYPKGVLDDYGIEIALIMCILCVISGWRGYNAGIKKFCSNSYSLNLYTDESYKRIVIIAVGLYLISFYGAYKLAELAGGFSAQFTSGRHYVLEWRGAPVMYSFLINYMGPSFFMMLLCTLRCNKKIYWILTAIFSLYPLTTIVFLGRRSKLAAFCVLCVLAVFFVYRKAPPRWMLLYGALFMGLVIIVGDAYRTISQYGLSHENIQKIKQIDITSEVKSTLFGKGYSEFDVIVVEGARATQQFDYGFGTSLWNSFIHAVIPRQLFGQHFKESLLVKRPFMGQSSLSLYGWEIPYGSNPTGPGSALVEFGFLGCLFYWVIGYAFAWLWVRAYYNSDLRFQIWYGVFVMLIPQTISGTINLVPGRLFWNLVVLYPLLHTMIHPAQKHLNLQNCHE